MNDKQVIFEGEKVGSSEAALLDKLNIRPFSYKMNVTAVYDNGQIFSKGILDIKPEDIISKLQKGIRNLAAASLEAGYPNALTAPHSILNAFKNLVGVTMESDYSFE